MLGWYRDLAATRGHSMSGPEAITYAEMLAWMQLTNTVPNPMEVSLIRELDEVYLEVTYERLRADSDSKKGKKSSA